MQKIFKAIHAEVAVATQDRPVIFQVITLFLLIFCIAVILISVVFRFSNADKTHEARKTEKNERYVSLASAPAHPLFQLKK